MVKLKRFYLLISSFFLLINCYAQRPAKVVNVHSGETATHSKWDVLLKKYVDDQGNVDYKSFKIDLAQLNTYIEDLARNPISRTAHKEERLAYYINLYNAGTVQLILQNYPLESIKDIARPWGKKRVRIGDKEYSLAEIEHGMLRKMEEPRIHFAINCASYSCPRLLNRAFTASKLEEQLETVTSQFINDPTRNKISKNAVELSKIFKWYKRDFTNKNTLIEYLNTYSDLKILPKADIKYLTYDWRLNEKR